MAKYSIYAFVGGVVSGRACDIWALGITCYYLAFVKLPFNGESVQEICASILNNPYGKIIIVVLLRCSEFMRLQKRWLSFLCLHSLT